MPTTIEALHKLSKEIESDIEYREQKWTAKYKFLKKNVKEWKKKAKYEKEMTRVLQRENERLWEFIFSRSLQMKTVDIPALGKKEIVDLSNTVDDDDDDDVPCVTPSKESDSSTVIKCESVDGDVDPVEKVVEKEVVEEEEEEEAVVEEEEEEEVVEEEEEEVVVEEEEEEEVVVEEEEEEEEEVVVEEEEEEEVVVEEEEVVVEEEVVEKEAEAEEEELFEVEIDGVDYYTSSEVNGLIYEKKTNGDVGEELGYFEDSEPGFYE